jgi:hypothetical protein
MFKRVIVIISPLLLIAIISLLWLGSSSNAAASETKLAEKQMQNFKYTIVANDKDEVLVQVSHKSAFASDIEKYRDEVTQLSQKHASANSNKKFGLTVTFKKPVSFEHFRKMLDIYSIEPSVIAIRTMSESGERGTISGLFDKSKGVPQADIDRIFISLQKSGKNVNALGIVDFEATILGSKYANLVADKDVYLADALDSVLTDEAKKLKPNAKSTKYRGPFPYWLMEDFGLVKY